MTTERELLDTLDAMEWAEAFMDRFVLTSRRSEQVIDRDQAESVMVTWFSNAFEAVCRARDKVADDNHAFMDALSAERGY